MHSSQLVTGTAATVHVRDIQYLTVSCLPAVGHVPTISRSDTRYLLLVADILWLVNTILDILWHVPSKVPDTKCSWHFECYYFSRQKFQLNPLVFG